MLKLVVTNPLISHTRGVSPKTNNTTIRLADPAFADELTDQVHTGAQRIIIEPALVVSQR